MIELNKLYYLKVVPKNEIGALNAGSFKAEEEWVIKKDHGKQFATRFTYTTKYAQRKKCYFQTENPTAAVKQAIVTAYPNQLLKNTFFIVDIIETKKFIEKNCLDAEDLNETDCIWIEEFNQYKEIEKIYYGGDMVIVYLACGKEIKFNKYDKILTM